MLSWDDAMRGQMMDPSAEGGEPGESSHRRMMASNVRSFLVGWRPRFSERS